MQVSSDDIILITGGITTVIALLVIFFFIIVIRYFRSSRQKQKEIFEAVLTAQENERTRIAHDLHDEIGPMLSAIRLNIGLVNSQREPAQVSSTVKEAQGNLDIAIQDVRRISRNLVPANIESKGLTKAIEDYINYLQKANTIQIIFNPIIKDISFNKLADTNLYRIIQELINNAIRHGNAKQIELQMVLKGNFFSITLIDDGKGFNVAENNAGIGLKSIRSRVELYGGQCEWVSGEGESTKFTALFDTKELK